LSYWVCVVARNAAAHLGPTLNSLLNQALQPKLIVIVNDGSSDSTTRILGEYQSKHPGFFRVLNLPDNGYDIRRVPRNINMAWMNTIREGVKTEYFMISGDDCAYPPNYARRLVSLMEAQRGIMVASGRPSTGGSVWREHSPSGSGRMIRCSFWEEIGGNYPVKAGWETWLLYKVLERGYEVELMDNLVFDHFRPRGAKHQFAFWGAAMFALGYHPLYALGRIAKNTVERNISVTGSLNMLRGYLQAGLGSSDPFISRFEESLREFVCTQQFDKIERIATNLLQRWTRF